MNEDEVTKHTGSEDFGINVAIAADPVLAKHAAEIRRLGKRLIEDAIKIGRHLAEARDHVDKARLLELHPGAECFVDELSDRALLGLADRPAAALPPLNQRVVDPQRARQGDLPARAVKVNAKRRQVFRCEPLHRGGCVARVCGAGNQGAAIA